MTFGQGHPVAELAACLGISSHSIYQGNKRYSKPTAERQPDDDCKREIFAFGQSLSGFLMSLIY